MHACAETWGSAQLVCSACCQSALYFLGGKRCVNVLQKSRAGSVISKDVTMPTKAWHRSAEP